MVLSDAEKDTLAAYLLNVETTMRDVAVALERSAAARETRDVAELERLDSIVRELLGRIDTLLRDFPSSTRLP